MELCHFVLCFMVILNVQLLFLNVLWKYTWLELNLNDSTLTVVTMRDRDIQYMTDKLYLDK